MASSPAAPLASASSPERSEHWLFCAPRSSLSPASDASSPPGEARRHTSGWAAWCQEGRWTLSGPSEGLPPLTTWQDVLCTPQNTGERPGGASALQNPHLPPWERGGTATPPGLSVPAGDTGDVRSATEAGATEARPCGAAAALTGHREVLSVDDVILDIEQALVPIVVGTAVQVLQVGHHRHAAPAVLAVRARRDGHRLLGRRVLLPEPAVGARESGQPGGSPSSLCRSCPQDRARQPPGPPLKSVWGGGAGRRLRARKAPAPQTPAPTRVRPEPPRSCLHAADPTARPRRRSPVLPDLLNREPPGGLVLQHPWRDSSGRRGQRWARDPPLPPPQPLRRRHPREEGTLACGSGAPAQGATGTSHRGPPWSPLAGLTRAWAQTQSLRLREDEALRP